jgi:hypothetical protein
MTSKKKFNKKGEGELLPEETLKIIIAVICIVVLLGLFAAVYFALTGNQSMKFAQDIVNGNHGIASEIRRVNAGGMDNNSFFIPNPSGWYVFSFVAQDIKPNSCAGSNCLCLCESLLVGIINTDSRQAQRCDSKGVCVAVPNLKKFDAIQIKGGGIFVSIKSINGQIQIAKQ